MAVRSTDNGKTWSKPVVAIDTDLDDRDPSVACLKDGTLLLNWFTVQKNQAAVMLARSTDNGKTWSEPVQLKLDSPYSFACSSPVRQLADGSLILGLYCEDEKAKKTFGATVRSNDGGKTWKDLAYIGEKADIYLDAETDVVPLKDGKLLAALRSSKVDMHYAVSEDSGKTWGPVQVLRLQGALPVLPAPQQRRHPPGPSGARHVAPLDRRRGQDVERPGQDRHRGRCVSEHGGVAGRPGVLRLLRGRQGVEHSGRAAAGGHEGRGGRGQEGLMVVQQ